MRNTYTSDIYLDHVDLNNIENEIENITKVVQQYFDYETMALRNVQINDDLGGKTIHLSFPRNLYELINNTTSKKIISFDTNYDIRYVKSEDSNNSYVAVNYKDTLYYIYAKNDTDYNPYLNYISIKLPNDVGVVTNISATDSIFQHIKVYDDESVIPDYEKNQYQVNDILTMKKIDNIEKGIENIGYYYYKPKGWLTAKEWLGKPTLGQSNNYGVGSKTISYRDLNRWITNINLTDFEELEKLTIWNTKLSNIKWNEENDDEWEEF